MSYMPFSRLTAAGLLTLLVAACGGGSSDPSVATRTGVLYDSPLAGVTYTINGVSGVTDANGRYAFSTGDQVSFSLAGVTFNAPVTAGSALSIKQLFAGADLTDNRVTNLARLLQTLDADGNTANGIDLTRLTNGTALQGLDLTVAPEQFLASNPAVASLLQQEGRVLMSVAEARAHLQASEEDVAAGRQADGLPGATPALLLAATNSVAEGQATNALSIPIRLSAPTSVAVSFSYALRSGTAVAGEDFAAATGTLTLPAGSDAGEIRVSVLGDTMPEPDETFSVVITEASNAVLPEGGLTQVVTLRDDDTVAAAPTVMVAAQSFSESLGEARVVLTRAGDLRMPLEVSVSTLAISARAGEDFTPLQGQAVRFAAGAGQVEVAVTLLPDALVEADETFDLAVTAAAGVTVVGSPARMTIQDDDVPLPVLTMNDLSLQEGEGEQVVRLAGRFSAPLAQPFTVRYATRAGSASDAGARADFVPVLDGQVVVPAGRTDFVLPVKVRGDAFEEFDESFAVQVPVQGLSPSSRLQATVTLANDEALTLMQVGTARRAVSPSDAQVAGQAEPYLGGTRNQQFHLGGYGFGPFKLFPGYGPFPEGRVGEAPLPVSNPPAGASCLSPDLTAAKRTALRCEDNIHVRVMVMLKPDGERVAFVTLDAIGAGNLIQDGLRQAVNEASCKAGLCISPRNVLFGQTHTHAGPDLQGLWGGVPREWLQQMLYAGAAQATTEALTARRPAQLSFARGDADVFNNYRRPKFRDEALHHQADPAITLLMARADDVAPDGPLLGSMLQFAAHPTTIGASDYRLPDGTVIRVPHPDYPLGATRELESVLGGTALYFNGPIADASPGGPADGATVYDRVKDRGRNLARVALALRAQAVPLKPVLAVRTQDVILPVMNPLFLGVGLLSQFNGYYQFSQIPRDQIPGFDQLPADQVAQFEAYQNQLPQPAPTARTQVSRLSLGGEGASVSDARLEIVTMPGEATNTFGQYIRDLAGDSPLSDARAARHTMLLGLTHNSFGYIIPEEEFSYVDPSGNAGLLLPGTGYEENVSLGPLTAPLLRVQGYNPLFGIAPADARNLPPAITDCQVAWDFGACLLGVGYDRFMQFFGLPSGVAASLKDGAGFLAEGCHQVAGPLEPGCALFDALAGGLGMLPEAPAPGAPGTGGGSDDAALTQAALLAQTSGCDFIDPANCLLPFPSNHFTKPVAGNETGLQVNISPFATPRNAAGKPVDVTDQNRMDGFSPGQALLVRVPGLDLDKTARHAPVPRNGRSADPTRPHSMADSLRKDSAVVVYDVTSGRPHLVWAELDANVTGYTPCDSPAPIQTLAELGGQQPVSDGVQAFRDGCNGGAKPITDGRAANDPTSDPGPLLIIRPGVNFEEGHRYVVGLRNLRDASDQVIPASPGFRLCRDGGDSPLKQIPAVAARCAALDDVMGKLADYGVKRDELFMAWDFTVASEKSLTARLLGIRDQTLGGAAPAFSISSVQNIAASGSDTCSSGRSGTENCIARIIKGTMTVKNFIDKGQTATGQGDADRQIGGKFWFNTPNPGPYDVPAPFPAVQTVEVPFTCHIPRSAFQGGADPATYTGPVRLSRPSLYGHGLFGSQGEIGQGQLRRFGNEHNFTFCATDWVGMAGIGDVANTVTILADMSNFPTLADRVQQGILNFAVMGRLLKDPEGFVKHPAFRTADGRPLIDNRDVFYDGNSQGGIDGGALVAISPDVHRGVLGVPGMNYSTLLQRSVDFDGYARAFYPAYPNTVDQQLVFGLIQMLWDRSENNGYAQHLGDGVAGRITVDGVTHVIGEANRPLPGIDGKPLPEKQVLLHPGFGDHQVTMISAEVMARTVGANGTDIYYRRPDACAGDVTHCFTTRDAFLATRALDQMAYAGLDLLAPTAAGYGAGRGSALVVLDEGKTATPPAGNVPPKADDFDPHEYPRNTIIARCQKARFLRTDGALVYSDQLSHPADCPQQTGDGRAFAPDLTLAAGEPVAAAAAEPDYGTGIAGALGRFMAQIGEAFMALIEGDFATAQSQGLLAFSNLGSGLQNAFTGSSNSLVAAFTGAAGGAPDPQSMFDRFVAGIGRFLGLQADPATSAQAVMMADRDNEAVVITGDRLLGWAGPAAVGQGYPYPSGAALTGDGAAVIPGAGDYVGNARSAHNGQSLDPLMGNGPNVPIREIVAYAYRDGMFTEIPVQVDERMPYYLANGNSSFSTYSGTDPELNYVWDIERWNLGGDCRQDTAGKTGKPDPAAGLDADDEIAFMAGDAGAVATPDVVVAWAGSRPVQQLLVGDPLDPSRQRAVYLVRDSKGSRFGKDHYVHYRRKANADDWIDRSFFAEDDPEKLGTSNTGYGPNVSGTVCDPVTGKARQSSDRFPRDGIIVETDTYQFETSGRWMKRSLKVRKVADAGPKQSSYWEGRPDLIDRWKGRAFQQSPDSVISLVGFEDEQVNWEANSALLGERCGPVRCMREVWGADSGTNVTKTETYYRDAVTYRYRVRVHPIPPDGLYTSWDYNRGAMVPAPGEGVPAGRYFTALRPQGVPIDGVNDDVGQVDGVPPVMSQCVTPDGPQPANGLCPMFFDAADPTFNLPLAFNNWEQVSAKGSFGSLVYIFELKGATTGVNPLVVPYYRDDACLDDGTGDDPVARPFPGESYAWNSGAVPRAYDARAGRALDHSGRTFADCLQRQGAHGAHGIHFFVTHDSDNAFTPTTSTEIDGQQWQFMVPTDAPVNLGDRYANRVRVPLQVVVTPLSPPSVPSQPTSAGDSKAIRRRETGGVIELF